MKQSILFLALFLLSKIIIAQDVNWEKIRSIHPDRVLLSGERQPAKVLLLGTFHFAYPNLDTHKTDSANFVDVMSAGRQAELTQLAEVIKRFAPTRVYIESSNQAFHDSLYQEYRAGRYKLGRNEVYQVAYRIAGLMNHERVYAVDAGSFANDNAKAYPWINKMWEGEPVDASRDRYWDNLYRRMYDTGDSIENKLTMLENFLLMAESPVLRRMHGHYLSGGFNTKSHDGPDILSMWWYSRNLRIYNNILKTRPGSEDRILVLFGNGHMPILKHCFESSPEFELLELKSFLK